MNKNLFNEDYISGMRLLLKEAKEQGVNIRKAQWVPHVSKMLSEHNLCYKFWNNTCVQNRIKLVVRCKTWYDLLYNPDICAFLWITTYERPTFWREKLWIMLGLNIDGEPIGYDMRLSDMKL